MALSGLIVDALLGIAILSAWIAAIGFARLTSALDRLHCIAFVTVGCTLPIVAAAFVADGPSTRAFKLLLMFVITLVAGAAINQAIARAVFLRDEAGERT